MPDRLKLVAAVLAGILIGSLFVSPVGAHFRENTRHLGVHAFTEFIRDRVYTRTQVNRRTYTRNQTHARFYTKDQTYSQAQANARFSATYCGQAAALPHSFPSAPCTAPNFSLSIVDSDGNVGQHTSIAIATDGNPVVSYFDDTNFDLKVVHCDDPACAGTESPQTVDSAGGVGEFTSVAIAPDGNPVVSYFDGFPNFDLKVVHCDDPACAGTESPQAVDSTGDVGQHTSIAIAPDGNPVVSYYDLNNTALKVVHCDDPACAGTESPETVDDAASVGAYSSIAIAPDGNPTVSYWDGTNFDLKVVHCDDPACAGGESPQTVDDAPVDVGRFTSIAIAPDGNPTVSYFDNTNSDLKVVHCDDPACAGGESPQTVDAAGSLGQYPSIAIAPDGDPTVSYWAGTNGDLKVARPGV